MIARQFFRKHDRVGLVFLEDQDAPLLCSFVNNPLVSQYLGIVPPIYLEEEQAWIQKAKNTKNQYTFGIVNLGQPETSLIGTISLKITDSIARNAITGTCIGLPEYWGKGLGSMAKQLLLEWVFTQLNMRRVYSEVIAFNERSIAYSKKCGYKIVARIPDHYYCNGKYWDQVTMMVEREQWLLDNT
ncbi:MAG: RimJ/RimL family protein N-acetyltransferase [Planctomycetota bacterium]|jgi:RimJ/RimL family protein N-acetyltransferase